MLADLSVGLLRLHLDYLETAAAALTINQLETLPSLFQRYKECHSDSDLAITSISYETHLPLIPLVGPPQTGCLERKSHRKT